MKNPDELLPTRGTLLNRLRDWSDQESWKIFFDTYWRLIYGAARNSGLTDEEAQDVVQETVLSVAQSMPTFEYDSQKGSFKAYLLQLTSWRIVDQVRKRQKRIEHRRPSAATRTETATVEKVPDPSSIEEVWDREYEANLIEVATERVKRKVDAKHYQVFDLLVSKRWPVAKVTKVLKMNRGMVYVIKHRLGQMIKKEVALLKKKPL